MVLVGFPDPFAGDLDDIAEALVGLAARLLLAGGGHFAHDGRRQPRQIALEDQIGNAVAHQIDGGFLADRAGNDDHRPIRIVGLADLEDGGEIGAGHVVVGQHDVPALPLEFGLHAGDGIDGAIFGIEAGAAQRIEQQRHVVGRILDDEDAGRAELGIVGSRPRAQREGASFSSSQYMPSWRAASMNSSKLTGLRT